MNFILPSTGEESVRKTARIRTRIILIAMILWASGIVLRLVHLQIFRHAESRSQIAAQNQDKVDIFPERGTISDRNGVVLAQMVTKKSIHYNASMKESLEARMAPVKKLVPVLGLDKDAVDSIRASVERKKPFIYIKRRIDAETAAGVEGLRLPGIGLQDEPVRAYPQGRLAAHVLGYVNIDNKGQGGVEMQFDEDLRGKRGKLILYRDTYQRAYRSEQTVAPERGKDVVLTIDAVIQYIAQREIEKAVVENNAAWGAVIVSDPATGEILAMASAPSYDPNQYGRSDPQSRYERAFCAQIDPGSTFKIVTAAAALENRKVATYETFNCAENAITVAGGQIRDHKPFGVLSFSGIIAESSNIGTIQIGRRVGGELMYKTIRDFGFGARTGLDLPAELPGIVHPPDEWSRRSLDSISVGYEVSVTPLQLLQAINVIANRGVRLPPRIIESVDGRPWPPKGGPSPVQVISAQTAEKLIDILERVVLDGTGTAAAVKGYTVAGKTGTSQIFDRVGGKYSLAHHTASFIGFAPTDKPVVSAAVVLFDPQRNAYYGGQVAAPVFREIVLCVLRHRGVFPSQEDKTILASALSREVVR
ncbi:MAG: peptidoglycan D,D-transpeptidase FtsI family protein [Candidatus Aminicenantales bacterium]